MPRAIDEVARALAAVPTGKLAIVTDYAVGDPNFCGQLPPTTKKINETLSRCDAMLLIGGWHRWSCHRSGTSREGGRAALLSELRSTTDLRPRDQAVVDRLAAERDAERRFQEVAPDQIVTRAIEGEASAVQHQNPIES